MKTESRELFELCKQVYEATGWDDTESQFDGVGVITSKMKYLGAVPLYTSDYLLEKLPKVIDAEDDAVRANWRHLRMTAGLPDGYNYYYEGLVLDVTADTPLKALLKLTLKLHEEEIL